MLSTIKELNTYSGKVKNLTFMLKITVWKNDLKWASRDQVLYVSFKIKFCLSKNKLKKYFSIAEQWEKLPRFNRKLGW